MLSLAVGALIGSAISAVAGGAATAASTHSANSTNMEINQMNNAFAAAEAQKNRDWQLDMWNKNNEYNSLSAQRERAEAAGYSPWIIGGSNSVGSSVPSGAQASPGSPGNQQPMDFTSIGSALGNVAQIMNELENGESQRKLTDASAQQVRIENEYKGAQMMTEIYKSFSEAKNSFEKAAYQRILNKYADTMQIQSVEEQAERIKNLKASYQQIVTQTALDSKELQYFDETRKASLALQAAQTFAAYKAGELSYQQAQESIAKKINTEHQTGLLKAQIPQENAKAKNAQAMADALLKQMEKAAEKLDRESYSAGSVPLWNMPSLLFNRSGELYDTKKARHGKRKFSDDYKNPYENYLPKR